MKNELKVLDLSTELKFINSRNFNYSIDKVFEMYSNPKYLEQWFGPNGFSNTFHQFDFKNNGDWIFTMHGPDGVDYENKNLFLKILKNELIVWNHLPSPNFQAQISFTKISDGKTKVDFIMLFYEKNVFDLVMKFAQEKNEENFDKLESLMNKTNFYE